MKKEKLSKIAIITSIAVTIPYVYNKYIEVCGSYFEDVKNNKHFFDTKFGKLKYDIYGNKKGKPLLLLHSLDFLSSSMEFSEVEKLLLEYKIYSIDLLGFGLSDKPNIAYSIYLYSILVNKFVKEVIGEPTNVLALKDSCSCIVKAYYLEKENFKKLILIEPKIYTEVTYNNGLTKCAKKFLEHTYLAEFIFNVSLSRPFAKMVRGKFVNVDEKNINSVLVAAYTGGKYKYLSKLYRYTNMFVTDIVGDIAIIDTDTLVFINKDSSYSNLINNISYENNYVNCVEIDNVDDVLFLDDKEILVDTVKKFI
ncbi:MAG: hypothetical protein ACK5LV_07725 [Lachnospirales bacterium]